MTKLGSKRTTPKKGIGRGNPVMSAKLKGMWQSEMSRAVARQGFKKKRVGQRSLQRKADILFSLAVRSRAGNKCEYCGKSGLTLHCHHAVVHRRYLNTRYEFDNAVSVCVGCHTFLGDFPRINTEFMLKKIGSNRYDELEVLARTVKGKFDYQEIIDKLSSKSTLPKHLPPDKDGFIYN